MHSFCQFCFKTAVKKKQCLIAGLLGFVFRFFFFLAKENSLELYRLWNKQNGELRIV